MSTQLVHNVQNNNKKANKTFYITQGFSTGSDFVYDETYKNYKIKQRFQKDPKYSYFNAVMQMKKKLSPKQQLFNNVFDAKITQHEQQNSQYDDGQKNVPIFYRNSNNQGHKLHLFYEPINNEVVKIEQLRRNSFKIVKEQANVQDNILSLRKQNSDVVNIKKRASSSFMATQMRHGHKSNMSLYEKHSAFGGGKSTNFQMTMTTKQRNNRSYVELQIQNEPDRLNVTVNRKQPWYQPSNPKPRLDEIISQYRKINKNQRNKNGGVNARRSSLPKQFMEKLYQTNKMFYNKQIRYNHKRVSLG